MLVAPSALMQTDNPGDAPRKQIRLPIIRPKDDQSSTSSTRSGRTSGPTVPPRARLPPRSRTGCWTCRQRKVKCDEGRPTCGQCGRLGHACDYSPRLSFRDDTLRVVERMQDVTIAGSNVWGPVISPTPSSAGSAIADDLPPFSALMTDEERERKAETSSPGTYNVIVNPDSFQHLPEYNDEIDIKREHLSPLRRASIAASLTSSLGRESTVEGVTVPGDPNTIILPRFEDISKRPTRDVKSPASPVAHSRPVEQASRTQIKHEQDDERDLKMVEHFRSVVWKQLVPTDDVANSSFFPIEKVAQDFAPLHHAVLAVACQSTGQHEQKENLDALQHYTQAIEYLKAEEDLASDGVFLTHFLMLIYEIASADIEHSLIRTHHFNMLIRITQLRRQQLGKENGAGTGRFVTDMLANETVPPPSFHLYPLGADGSSVVFGEERESLPTVLQLDYDITLLSFQLASLSHEFRQDSGFSIADPRQRDMMVRLRQSRMYEIQESLRQRWAAPNAIAIGSRPLPWRSRRIWEHAFALFRAALIYSHTSMWPAQRLDTSAESIEELSTAITGLLQLAQGLIHNGQLECRYLVFPVFIAGFASTDGRQKALAIDLLVQMESASIGRNTTRARKALESVYRQQNEQFLITGHSLDVDWMITMAEQGLSVVQFGM